MASHSRARSERLNGGLAMVLGHHIIFTAYGFWLPNDPRGSWSNFVASWELFRYGEATKTDTRRSVAGKPHDRQLREDAKAGLKYPPVVFSDAQIQTISDGIAESAHKGGLTIWACAILPDHVHLVVARHKCKAEMIMNLTKGACSKKLLAAELHPFKHYQGTHASTPSCWAAKGWNVFLDSAPDIVRSISYVERNPEKEGRPAQAWPFVTPFDPTMVV
jgi:REP element-mobilizing transposase RayT